MGALRAAELWPFCTLGVGCVFTFYRDGVITGDDEVPSSRPGRRGVPATERAAGQLRVTLTAAALLERRIYTGRCPVASLLINPPKVTCRTFRTADNAGISGVGEHQAKEKKKRKKKKKKKKVLDRLG